ncbi:glycosyltransferase family 4 protein [Candidatus Curtissbacteria bacterium]|nr:glycosyltransferase family 4 protein [Candidatus Curtissbacteria bacterium]
MRILWLSWRDIKNPDAGGAEKVAIEITSRLTKEKHQVTIFTSLFKGAKKQETTRGVNIIRRGNRLTCRFFAFLYWLKNKKFDLVIDEINTIPFFSIFYAPAKTLTLIHQLASEFWFSQTIWPLSTIGYWLEPFALKLYKDRPTIVVSKSTQKDLQKLGFKNTKIVREGLDFKPQFASAKEDLILFIGRLIEPKGPRDAITAFRKTNDIVTGTKLVIIGRGDPTFTANLKRQTITLGLKDKVKFTGFIPESQKIELLKKAKVVLIPSIREGWGLVATETSALGAVPIAYNVPGLRDSIANGKTGILTETNPQALAQAAIDVLKKDQLRKRLAKNGYLWSQKFSWENCYQDFKRFVLRPGRQLK